MTLGTTLTQHADYKMPSGYNPAGQPNEDGSPCNTNGGNNCDVKALQLRTVPISQINEITIQFSEPMKATSLGSSSLLVKSALTCTTYPIATFSLAPDGLTGKWTLSTPIVAANGKDQIEVTLSGAVDMTDTTLDADWKSPDNITDSAASFFPSGNLNSGNGSGIFEFRFTVLPADFNRDNLVDGSDFGIWNSNKFTTVSPTGTGFRKGDANGDDLIDGSDFGIWNSQKFTTYASWPTSIPPCGESTMSEGGSEAGLLPGGPSSSWLLQYDLLLEQYSVFDGADVNESLSDGDWEAFADELMELLGQI